MEMILELQLECGTFSSTRLRILILSDYDQAEKSEKNVTRHLDPRKKNISTNS